MGAMASQITSITIAYSTVYSCDDQRKHQSHASLAFVPGIPRRPANSPHKWPVTRKFFPVYDFILNWRAIFISQGVVDESFSLINCSKCHLISARQASIGGRLQSPLLIGWPPDTHLTILCNVPYFVPTEFVRCFSMTKRIIRYIQSSFQSFICQWIFVSQ